MKKLIISKKKVKGGMKNKKKKGDGRSEKKEKLKKKVRRKEIKVNKYNIAGQAVYFMVCLMTLPVPRTI